MASNGVRAEFYTGHQALPETFEVYSSAEEDDPDPITAAAEIEWMVWRDFAGFTVARMFAAAEERFTTMAGALAHIGAAMDAEAA